MDYRIWRQEPKRGESPSSGWCASISSDGHIVDIKTGFDSESDALAWVKTFIPHVI